MSTLVEEYYTPELEEFHKGFEFESNYVLFSNDLEWKPIIFGGNNRLMDDLPWFYSAYENDAVPTEFRVKYLDREDIESLGFKFRGGAINDGHKPSREYYTHNYNKDIELRYYTETNQLTVFNGSYDGEVAFIGKIKNKSEFNRLMKQLEI